MKKGITKKIFIFPFIFDIFSLVSIFIFYYSINFVYTTFFYEFSHKPPIVVFHIILDFPKILTFLRNLTYFVLITIGLTVSFALIYTKPKSIKEKKIEKDYHSLSDFLYLLLLESFVILLIMVTSISFSIQITKYLYLTLLIRYILMGLLLFTTFNFAKILFTIVIRTLGYPYSYQLE